MKTFHNTIDEKGHPLFKSQARARSQQEHVLAFLYDHPLQHFTPFEIHRQVLPYAPITSVRRALTNLQKAGYLEKTGIMVLGNYDKNNHTWRLKSNSQEQMGLFK